MSKRRSVLYFPYGAFFSRVKGHKGSPVLPRLLAGIVRCSLPRRISNRCSTAPARTHYGNIHNEIFTATTESLRAAEAKNAATINQLKYRSRSCIMENVALGAWFRANKSLGCASCSFGSRPCPRTLTSI